MKNLSASVLVKPFAILFRRFHMTLFILFVAACLGYTILQLSDIINNPAGSDGYVSPIGTTTIDQSALERIKSLHTSDEKLPNFTAPSGRSNPFAE